MQLLELKNFYSTKLAIYGGSYVQPKKFNLLSKKPNLVSK